LEAEPLVDLVAHGDLDARRRAGLALDAGRRLEQRHDDDIPQVHLVLLRSSRCGLHTTSIAAVCLPVPRMTSTLPSSTSAERARRSAAVHALTSCSLSRWRSRRSRGRAEIRYRCPSRTPRPATA